MDKKPLIQLYALGGTIAMVPCETQGVTPTLSADDLVAAVPQIASHANLRAETLAKTGSANLTEAFIRDVCRRAENSDADAIIVTQGTDTMEETSFLASLLYKGDKPLIFTGAMRSPNLPSADGPANLLASVITACHLSGKGGQVLLVINGDIHDPWHVSKQHTSSRAAFVSEHGPRGNVVEGKVSRLLELPPRPSFDFKTTGARVGIVSAVLDMDTILLEAAANHYDALVVQSLGAGHLSEVWTDAVTEIAKSMPVVLSSRAAGGRIFERTYGYKGAEIDLIERGLVPAADLQAYKARIALSLVLGSGTDNWQDRFKAIADAA